MDRVEDHHAHWFAWQAGAPGVMVAAEPDVTWITHPGVAWGNALIRVRLDPARAEHRLDHLLGRFRSLNRPVTVWTGPESQPDDLETRLRRRGLRCRKRYPGMLVELDDLPAIDTPRGVTIEVVDDFTIFEKEHPAIGRITTPNRRQSLARTIHACTREPLRAFQLLARLDGTPAGAAIVFLDDDTAGLHDVGVPEALRNRGIGSALVAHATRFARAGGATAMVLIASGMGESVYRRAGFREVCRLGCFYSKLGRAA